MTPFLVINRLNKSEEEINNLPQAHAARCVLLDENDNVVLVSYDDENVSKEFGRMYGIAGGHIKEGETPEVACKREVLEETGFVVSEVVPIGTIHFVRKNELSISHGFGCRVHASQQQKLQMTQEEKDGNHTSEIHSFDDAVAILNHQYVKVRQGATLRNLTFLLEAKHLLDSKKKTS